MVEFLVREVGVPLLKELPGMSPVDSGARLGGETALHCAARGGHVGVVRTLRGLGAAISRLVKRRIAKRREERLLLSLSPLGEAVLCGSLRCVRELIDLAQSVADWPELPVIACVAGHLDALRMVLPFGGATAADEAYSVAFALGRRAICEGLLCGRTWCWTKFVVWLLRCFPSGVTGALCEGVGLTEASVADGLPWRSASLVAALHGALVGERITRATAEMALRRILRENFPRGSVSVSEDAVRWGSIRGELWSMRRALLALGVHIERILPDGVDGFVRADLIMLLAPGSA